MGILHWRLDGLATATPAAHLRGPLASLPPGTGPELQIARQVGELMRQRWPELRTARAATDDVLSWAPELGPQPTVAEDTSAWLTAATAVTV